jgi:hypothetical protein
MYLSRISSKSGLTLLRSWVEWHFLCEMLLKNISFKQISVDNSIIHKDWRVFVKASKYFGCCEIEIGKSKDVLLENRLLRPSLIYLFNYFPCVKRCCRSSNSWKTGKSGYLVRNFPLTCTTCTYSYLWIGGNLHSKINFTYAY